MKKEKIILQLGVEIDTFKAHIQRLKKENYKLHQMDVELLQQKTRGLYDMLFELEKEAKSPLHAETKIVAKKEPEIEIQNLEPTETTIEDVKEETVHKEVPVVKTKPKELVEEKIQKIEPEIEDPQPKAQPTEEKPSEVKSHFDLFSESSTTTVSDKLAGSDGQSLGDKMQDSRITDLRQSVGINEKFLFINELFNGDMGRYNKAIDELNEMKTLQGVDTFLLELKVQNQWDDELTAYFKLKELAERKFK